MSSLNKKLIFDPVHKYMELDSFLFKFIDTPEFQRLKTIKQLGTCYWVFPGASHNRFEHSIGVAYLAGQLMENISSKQPELGITPRLILLVQLAGLLHDFGHACHSHFFDNIFLDKCDRKVDHLPERHHEYRSGMMIDFVVEKYGIELTPLEIKMIKRMIDPVPGEDVGYLYEIIANKLNSLDVDKFDYISRDNINLGLNYQIDYSQLIKRARVIDNHICYPDKTCVVIYEFFRSRYLLHKTIYKHPAVQEVELMISDAMIKADPILKISDSISDPKELVKMTDNLLQVIRWSSDKRMQESRDILEKLDRRCLYQFVGEIKNNGRKYTKKDFIFNDSYDEDDIEIINMTLGYTNKATNPVDNVFFYNKKDINTAFHIPKEKVSDLIPNNFRERYTRIFCKNRDKYTTILESLPPEIRIAKS